MDIEFLENIWNKAGISSEYLMEMKQVCAPSNASSSNSLAQLPLLFCELNGGNKQQVKPVITAWNILRFAARLLDDIEDQDVKKRSLAEPVALNISTGLLFTVGVVLSTLEADGLDFAIAADIRYMFYKELLKVCSGQHLDIVTKSPTLEECWQISGAKSGLFIGLICWAGGRIANAEESQLELYQQFGYNLGLLDQIKDDLADLWATESHHSDLQNGFQYSLPIAYALSVLPENNRQQLLTYLTNSTPDAEIWARKLIIQSGAGVYLTVQSTYYIQQSQQLLKEMMLPSDVHKKLNNLLENVRLPIIEA